MKRLLYSVALLIISSFVCLAQTDESRHEVSLSYGYITLPQAVDLIGAGGGAVLGGLLVGIVDVIAPGDPTFGEITRLFNKVVAFQCACFAISA